MALTKAVNGKTYAGNPRVNSKMSVAVVSLVALAATGVRAETYYHKGADNYGNSSFDRAQISSAIGWSTSPNGSVVSSIADWAGSDFIVSGTANSLRRRRKPTGADSSANGGRRSSPPRRGSCMERRVSLVTSGRTPRNRSRREASRTTCARASTSSRPTTGTVTWISPTSTAGGVSVLHFLLHFPIALRGVIWYYATRHGVMGSG